MKKMKKCSACGQEIAANAKACPHCGNKNKKPFYKRWWFWLILIIVIFGAASGGGDTEDKKVSTGDTEVGAEVATEAEEKDDNVPTEYKSALNKAEAYSDMMYMSKQGIYDQLTSEYGDQFTEEAAQYAIDNLEADYKENALQKAKIYQDEMDMSPAAIKDQLVSEYGEQFTEEEAEYAVSQLK